MSEPSHLSENQVYMDIQQKSQELNFSVQGLNFAAQAWGNPAHLPVLALHGWLDNSASFYKLAPQLNGLYVVALDMAGHGQSSHRLSHAPYNIWEDVSEIFAIADHLGWKQFALLGHSRGGIIATLAAGTIPDRISHLALIEGILPEPVTIEETPLQLARSIHGLQKKSQKNLNIYSEILSAIDARERGMFPLSRASATVLTERGVKKVEGGFTWSTDPKLLVPSAVKLLPEQMAAFIHRISAPAQLILGEEGMPKMFHGYTQVMQKYPKINTQIIPGGHHLHMEEECGDVAKIFNEFFAQ